MPGPVALVGAGEFLPEMAEFDAGLLAAAGRNRPRVAIMPTASFPDGEEVFTRWAAMGVSHFGELGAEVEPVLVRDRSGADDHAAAQADRRGRRGLPVGRQAGLPDGRARRQRGRPGAGRGAPSRRDHRRLLGGCDGAGRPCLRLPGPPGALAAAVAGRPRAGRGRIRHPALRRVAGAVLGAHRAPGAARLARARHRRGDRASSGATARGRSTAGRG